MSSSENPVLLHLNLTLNSEGGFSPEQKPTLNKTSSRTLMNAHNETEIMMKAVRYMTPAAKLKKNTKLLGNILSYRETMLRIIMNDKRTENDAWAIYDYLKDFKFFQQYVNSETLEPEAIVHIMRNLKYEKHKKGHPIFLEGDSSNGKVYILFSGQLYVMTKKLHFYEQQNLMRENSDKKLFGISSNSISRRDSIASQENEDKQLISSRKSPVAATSTSPNNSLGTPRKGSLSNQSLSSSRRSSVTKENQELSIENSPRKSSITDKTSPQNSARKTGMWQTLKDTIFSRKNSGSLMNGPTASGENTPRKNSAVGGDYSPRNTGALNYKKILTKQSIFAEEKVALQNIENQNLEGLSSEERSWVENYGFIRDRITERGTFFGEKALESDQKRGATILAATDCELLYLTKEVFSYIQKAYNKEKRRLSAFLLKYVPSLDQINSQTIMDSYLYLFQEKTLELGNHLIVEGEQGENIYMLTQGEAEVYRTIIIEDSNPLNKEKLRDFFVHKGKIKENIVLAKIQEGTFVGEELIQKEVARYQFSVRITSDKAKFLCITKNRMRSRLPADSTQKIKAFSNQKKAQKDKVLLEQLARRGLKLKSDSIDCYPLVVQRVKPLDIYHETPKINSRSFPYQSLQFLSPTKESKDEFTLQNRLPVTPSSMNEKQSEFGFFSRKNYFPPTKELPTSPKESSTASLQARIMKKAKTELLSPQNHKKLESIRSERKQTKFRNLNEFFTKVEKTFHIEKKTNLSNEQISDINHFKLDFGRSKLKHEVKHDMTERERSPKINFNSTLHSITDHRTTKKSLSHLKSIVTDPIMEDSRSLYFKGCGSPASNMMATTRKDFSSDFSFPQLQKTHEQFLTETSRIHESELSSSLENFKRWPTFSKTFVRPQQNKKPVSRTNKALEQRSSLKRLILRCETSNSLARTHLKNENTNIDSTVLPKEKTMEACFLSGFDLSQHLSKMK